MKDLRIEKEPEKKTHAPQVPDDPAILGVSHHLKTLPALISSSHLRDELSRMLRQKSERIDYVEISVAFLLT